MLGLHGNLSLSLSSLWFSTYPPQNPLHLHERTLVSALSLCSISTINRGGESCICWSARTRLKGSGCKPATS